jgi:hypothetical protein
VPPLFIFLSATSVEFVWLRSFYDLIQFRFSSYSNMSGQGPFSSKVKDTSAVMVSGDV